MDSYFLHIKVYDIIIVLLVFLCAGLCVWCLYLDSKVDQLKGYIRRLEIQHDIKLSPETYNEQKRTYDD